MKLSELFEDTAATTDQAFNMAWQNIRSSIPANYRSKVQGKARELMNKGESPSDALSLARTAVVPADSMATTKQQNVPTQQAKPKATKKDAERYSKRTGKRWGNQYYKDPAKSGGIKGAVARNTPQALIKKGAQWVDQEVGDAMDIGKALTPLNKRKRS